MTDAPFLVPTPEPVEPKTWYKNSWTRWLAIGTVVTIAVATIAVALMSIMLNFSAYKALFDATDYVFRTPGTYHFTADNTDMVLKMNNNKYEAKGKLSDAEINLIIDGNMIYFKSSEPDKLITQFAGELPAGAANSAINGLMQSLKDKWISMNLKNPPIRSFAISGINCFVEARKELIKHPSSWVEVSGVFNDSPLFSISQPRKSTYLTTYDKTKLDGFYKGIVKTTVYKLPGCTSVFKKENIAKLEGLSAIFAMTQPGSVPKSIIASNNSGGQTKITSDYSKAPIIEAPSEAVDVAQIAGNLILLLLGSK